MNATLRPLAWLALAAAAALGGCGNPSTDVRIDALGPEAPGTEPSEEPGGKESLSLTKTPPASVETPLKKLLAFLRA